MTGIQLYLPHQDHLHCVEDRAKGEDFTLESKHQPVGGLGHRREIADGHIVVDVIDG